MSYGDPQSQHWLLFRPHEPWMRQPFLRGRGRGKLFRVAARKQDKPCTWSPLQGTAVMDEPSELSRPCKGTGSTTALGVSENTHLPAAFVSTQCGLGVSQAMGTSFCGEDTSWEPIPGMCAVPRQERSCKTWRKPKGDDLLLQHLRGSPLCGGSSSCCHQAPREHTRYAA